MGAIKNKPDKVLRAVAKSDYFVENLKITSGKTLDQYEIAFNFFDRFLGRPAKLSDLTEQTITRFLRYLHFDLKLAAKTANERAGRIIALWNWLARRRQVDMFPTVGRLKEAHRTPRAWTIDELQRLFAATDRCRGDICGVPASLWCKAMFAVIWNTGERIGAVLDVEWQCLDRGTILFPARIRKFGKNDETFTLWPETMGLLDSMRTDFLGRPLKNRRIFETKFTISNLYYRFKQILSWANLPSDRYCKFHKIRVSHATWTQAFGGNATAALRHASPVTTQKHYIDPTICKIPESILPRVWGSSVGNNVASGGSGK